MGLETATYIHQLVPTNPIGASDPKSQGDDHIRLMKQVQQNTFPNIQGAVTASHTELNFVDGVTSAIQTQLDSKLATNGNGSAVTNLNASALASGTVPDARFPASLPAINGANLTSLSAANITAGGVLPALNGAALTNLNASNIATGTIAAARLPIVLTGSTYTPGTSNTLNCSVSSVEVHQYLRVGNIVNVSGAIVISIVSGGAAATAFDVDVPIASAFTTGAQAHGAGMVTTSNSTPVAVFSNSATDKFRISFTSTASGAQTVYYTVQYEIV